MVDFLFQNGYEIYLILFQNGGQIIIERVVILVLIVRLQKASEWCLLFDFAICRPQACTQRFVIL